MLENAVLNVDVAPGRRPRAHVLASSAGERCRVSGVYPALTLVLELTLTLLCELYGEAF